MLLGGNSSRLYRTLVPELEVAASAHASLAPFRDPGLYEISVSLQRGRSAAEAEKIVYDELARFAPTAVELETARTRLQTRFWRELRPQAGKAEALGHYQTTAGDYRRLFEVAEALERVSGDDVTRVAQRYLVAEARTVVIATPGGEDEEES